MPNSINWRIATLAAELTHNGFIDSDGLAFDLPVDVSVKTPSTSFSSNAWPGNLVSLNSTYDENGVLYVAAEDADFEGAATFWDSGQNSFETISFTEWGGAQGVQNATITETSTPDYNAQYKDTNVTLSSPSITAKNIGEDPLNSRSWTTSGTTVALSSSTAQNITVYNPGLQGNTDGSTTITLTLTDNQGQTDTDTITISWRANRNPTAPTGITFNRTQPVTPGTSVTATATGATDEESDTIYYQFESTGTPSLGISTSWSTSANRTFTVPEYDDNSDSWSVSVRVRTSRSISGVDPSSWFTATFTGKRSRRYADEVRVQSITEYNRGSGTSSFNPGNVSYPSGTIANGDMLYLSFGAYNAPSNVTWNNVSLSAGYGVAIKGDNLNGSGSSYTLNNPNTSTGSPDIVSSEGWERAFNTSSNTSVLSPSTYTRSSCSASHAQDYLGSNNLSCTTTLDQFYKIADGTESGTIPLWDWTPNSTYGYGHTHIGEGVFVLHLKAYDKWGNRVPISEISQIYANNRAWNRQTSPSGSGNYQFDYELTTNTIGGDGLTDDAIFCGGHVITNGFYSSTSNRYRIDTGGAGNQDTNHGLYSGFNTSSSTSSTLGYQVILTAFETGDTSSGNTGYTNSWYFPFGEMALKEYDYADDLRVGRIINTEFWNSFGNSDNNDGIGTTGGVFIYGAHHFNTLCVKSLDVKDPTTRDYRLGYYRTSAGSNEVRHSSGAISILQVRAHDTLYDGAY